MSCLALNIYLWTPAEQNRVLTECIGPLLHSLRERNQVRHAWFSRFDVRGSHLFLALSVPAGAGEVRTALEVVLERYLARHPATQALSAAELQLRHDQCRGTRLCAVDGEPGFAEPGTFRIMEHPDRGYPFGTTSTPLPELWDQVAEATLWSIDQLRAGSYTAAAVRWVAEMDRALRRAGADATSFWRYHATTLVLTLGPRLQSDEEAVLAVLPGSVTERNRELFGRIWEAEGQPVFPGIEALVSRVTAAETGPVEKQRAVMREIDHAMMQQLGQQVMVEIPLILYAWHRGIAADRGAACLKPGGVLPTAPEAAAAVAVS